jgi:hypothetical protein
MAIPLFDATRGRRRDETSVDAELSGHDGTNTTARLAP